MGQKINPTGFRLAVSRNWSSKWYASNKAFAPMLAEDLKVRAFLKKKLAHASVGRVLIERPAKDARITNNMLNWLRIHRCHGVIVRRVRLRSARQLSNWARRCA